MQTDTLFQEYFQIVPEVIFELLGETPPCRYRYESPVVKASERRLDGFLSPEEPGYPYYFVEIQGYRERLFYWRCLNEVTRYHEVRPELDGQHWRIIVIYLDRSHDPGVETLGPLGHSSERWLTRVVLPELLAERPGGSAPLNVLRPLAAIQESEVEREGAAWV